MGQLKKRQLWVLFKKNWKLRMRSIPSFIFDILFPLFCLPAIIIFVKKIEKADIIGGTKNGKGPDGSFHLRGSFVRDHRNLDFAHFDAKEREIVDRYMDLIAKNSTFEQLYKDTFLEGFERIRQEFNCPELPPSTSVPTSVHKLRPGDIRVVAAMGDSYTAGRGAHGGIMGLLADFPGKTWSIGGDAGLNTMANILREYNSDLRGFSTSGWWWWSPTWKFNVATSGHASRHMLGQAQKLVQEMNGDSNVDMDNDWKVITLFIGGNDLCEYCSDKVKYSAANYKANIQSALDYLHQNVPRAFVNLVEIFNMGLVEELARGFVCTAVHAYVCDCASNPENDAARNELSLANNAYRDATLDLATSGRYDTRDDFTVVLQPLFRDAEPIRKADGEIDYSYWAADCFHPSGKGQQITGEALWNNMFEPVGSKHQNGLTSGPMICPDETYPYLYTSKNSLVDGGDSPSTHVDGVFIETL